MIEHGTPKSEFVKLVYDVYIADKLTKALLDSMLDGLLLEYNSEIKIMVCHKACHVEA